MSQVKVTNAQYPLVFSVEVGKADVNQELAIDVPAGFILTNMSVSVRTAFVGGVPSYSIVDNLVPPTPLMPTKDAAVVGTELMLDMVRFTEYPNGGKIRILFVSGSPVTAGRADVMVQGIIRGRQNERYGANIVT